MTKILTFSDVHGNIDAVKELCRNTRSKKYDAIIFAGDFASFRNVQEHYQETMELLSTPKSPCFMFLATEIFHFQTPLIRLYLGRG